MSDSSDENGGVSSDDEQERFGRRLPRHRYQTVDDDDDGGDRQQGRRKRSHEEAIYGIFMDENDNDDEEGGGRYGRRKKKPFFKESSARASQSKTAPLFVKGDMLAEEEKDEDEGNADHATTEKETENRANDRKDPSSSSDPPMEGEPEAKPEEPPTEEQIALQKQRQEANQHFLSLMDRAKRKGSRPTMANEAKTSESLSKASSSDADSKPPAMSASANPGLGMTRSQGTDEGPSMPSFTSAGMSALGLGMPPPKAAAIRKDPNLGTWEKHTKGIGMKLLAKMGYKGAGGLGSKRRQEAQKTGISRAVEVKVRPNQLGLGFGGFKEASTLKVNRQLEAQVRGEAPPPVEPAVSNRQKNKAGGTAISSSASALPTNDDLFKDSTWQKGSREVASKKKPEKRKRTVIPYSELLASKAAAEQTTKIVDLRGPDAVTATLSSVTGQDEEEVATGPPPLGEELLHNVSLLLQTYESRLHSHSMFASSAEQKLNSLQTEVEDLQRQKETVSERHNKMARATEILEAYESQIGTNAFDAPDGETQWEAAVATVRELGKVFSAQDRQSLKFDTTLAPTLLGDALQTSIKRWNPFRQMSHEQNPLSLVESILQLELTFDGEEDSTLPMKRKLFLQYALPRIQQVYDSAYWDVQSQADVGVQLYDDLIKLVKHGLGGPRTGDESDNDEPESMELSSIVKKIQHAVIFEIVHPKLERALSKWTPSLDTDSQIVHPLHEWIMPWVPFLDHPGILPTLMSQCKRRVESTVAFLSRKIPSDRHETFLVSFQSTLRPWARAFKSSSVHDLTTKYASGRLMALIVPDDTYAQSKRHLFEFHESALMSSIDFLTILECDIFLRCIVPAYRVAIASKGDISPIVALYKEQKGSLEDFQDLYPFSWKAIRTDEMMARCFLAVLRMAEAIATGDSGALDRLEPPSEKCYSYTTIRARRVQDHKRGAQADLVRMEAAGSQRDKLAAQTRARFARRGEKATFREVVEDFCAQESIAFMPRTSGARTHVDGKQVFLLGGTPVYLDADVVYAHEGENQWEPTSLESLLERAKASQ